MIVDMILGLLANVLSVFLAPLEIINIGIDIISSIPIVAGFIQIIAYLLPWDNLLPLIFIIFAILAFKLVIAGITALLDLIPFI